MSGTRLARFVAVVSFVGVEFSFPGVAGAVQSFLNISGINGEDPTPGYPDAMAVSSVWISPNELTITKAVDSASPQLLLAVVSGDPLGTSNLLLYNGAPAGPPDARLDFLTTYATGYQTLDGITETVGFNAENPLALFLEVPGIPGESSTPGHPGIIDLESFSLSGNQFEIVKQQDGASDDLFLANVMGEFFPVTRLLVYDSLPPGAAPDALIEFQDVYITSSQIVQGGVQPLEEHTFSFNTLSQVPEPAAVALVALASAIIAIRRGRRLGFREAQRAGSE